MNVDPAVLEHIKALSDEEKDRAEQYWLLYGGFITTEDGRVLPPPWPTRAAIDRRRFYAAHFADELKRTGGDQAAITPSRPKVE